MDEVESGTELLVFRGFEDEEDEEDDGEGDILVVRKWLLVSQIGAKKSRQKFDPLSFFYEEDTWIPSLDRVYSRFMFCIPVWDIGSLSGATYLPKVL